MRCVKRKSGILLRGEEPRHQVDEVSVAIAREGEELVSLQNQLRIVVRKKRDYVEKIPKGGGRGLTPTHSIFFSVFFSNSGAYKMAKNGKNM